jgi:hypothetical protein
MFDPLEIHEERRRLRLQQARAERLRPRSHLRHSLAVLLRRTADRLEPAASRPGLVVHPVS